VKSELRFAFFPAGDENTASSRIRVYSPARIFQKRGISFSIGDPTGANVFYIQKKVTPDLLRQARRAKWNGCAIVYDIDDFGEAMTYWVSLNLFRKIVRLADIILTATPEQAELLHSMYGVRGAKVLPSCVDYYPPGPVSPLLTRGDVIRLLWFGSSGNFRTFEGYLKTLQTIPNIQVVVCLDQGGKELLSKYKVEFVPWNLFTFISVLQSCHITCLTHENTTIGRAKTNNKMITSIVWGVPAVVTRTPDYLRTAQQAGVEYATFLDEEELKSVVEQLRSPEARERYLDHSQEVIWNQYSPSVIADHILNIISEFREASLFRKFTQIAVSYL